MITPENETIEQIRKRPSMYVFSTTLFGLNIVVGEIVSNAIDQYLLGHATQISVAMDGREVRIADDGAGLPFEQPSTLGNESLLVDYLTTMHQTPTADNHAPHVHVHASKGLGIIIANALCESLRIRSWRDGKLWEQSFSRGKPVSAATHTAVSELPGDCEMPFGHRGTEILFVADPEIFGELMTVPLCWRRRLFDAAHLFAGMKVNLQDEIFCAPDGLKALAVTTLGDGLRGVGMFHHRIENENYTVEVSAIGNAENTNSKIENAKKKTAWHSWANGWQTHKGTHIDVFNEVLVNLKWKPAHAWIHIIMNEPEFAGPTQQELNVPHISEELSKELAAVTEDYCRKLGRGIFRKRD